MLVSELARRVRAQAGDNAVLQFSNTTLADWINDGVRECVQENSLLEAKATTATVVNQTDYTLPVDIFKLHSVWLDNFKLEMVTLQEFEERNATEPGISTSPGPSFLAYVYAGVLTLWPTPDAVYPLVINYTKLPAAITYAGPPDVWTPNTLSIPEAFHNRIVTYCLAQVAQQDDDHEKYQSLMAEFTTGVRDLKHTKHQQEDLYPSISVSSRDMGENWFDDHFIP